MEKCGKERSKPQRALKEDTRPSAVQPDSDTAHVWGFLKIDITLTF